MYTIPGRFKYMVYTCEFFPTKPLEQSDEYRGGDVLDTAYDAPSIQLFK